ncbi:MAG TPA: Lrp/AsnC family transcriptional regulator [Polyangiaceae bacterium]|nr:Lrp/AsnC family transcriptional regulator [Polyangiaceae bacterium]
MDDIDRQILRLLQEDARRPLKSIAGEVGLARSSVRERIGRLEASGVIRRYTAEIAPPAGGGGALGAFLLVRLEKTPARDAVGKIVAHPEVVRCHSVSGDIDLIVELRAGDMSALNEARDRIALEAKVADVTTAVVLRREKGAGD